MSQDPDPASTGEVDDDGPLTIRDDQLPEDVQPREDNPLAQPAGDDAPDTAEPGVSDAASQKGSGDAATRVDDASGTSSGSASPEPLAQSD